MLRSRRKRSSVQVDLVPMIDIVFQIILFFLVSTTFALLPGIKLNLPDSSTSGSESTGGITITMEENGNLWFNDEEVNMLTLDRALKEFDKITYEERAEYPVSLEADSMVTNGSIVQIFDVLRQNGFSAVNLRTLK